MKRFLFCLLFVPGVSVWGQAPYLSPAQLKKQVKNYPAEDYQYLNCETPKQIVLFNIVKENQLLKKDSTFADSRLQYHNVLKYSGSNLAPYYTQIVYLGKLSNKNSICYTYHNNQYVGSGPWRENAADTIEADFENWRWLGANKYVRVTGDTVCFHVVQNGIDKDDIESNSELTGLRLLVEIVGRPFRMYKTLMVAYHDRLGTQPGIRFEVEIDDLLITHLQTYLNEIRKERKR